MTVLVTGATGLVGNNVLRLLVDRGEAARAMIRKSSARAPLAGLDVDTVYGDVRDADAVQAACRGVQVVIHAAAHVHFGWSGRRLHQAVNVTGTANVADAALAAGARMVHVSSVDALGVGSGGKPADEDSRRGKVPCPYVLSKRAAEQALLKRVADGLDATIVNPGYLLGPWDWKPSSGRVLLGVAKRFAPAVPYGGNSFCDVRDVAAGILSAVERGRRGRRYILSGENLTYLEAWRLFAEVTGGRPPWMRMGPLVQIVVGAVGDLWWELTGKEADVNSAAVASAGLLQYYTSARARTELDYRPRPVRQAAEAAWEWFKQHGYV